MRYIGRPLHSTVGPLSAVSPLGSFGGCRARLDTGGTARVVMRAGLMNVGLVCKSGAPALQKRRISFVCARCRFGRVAARRVSLLLPRPR